MLRIVGLFLAGLVCLPLAAAPGSWQGRAEPLRVSRSDQPTCSEPMPAPSLARGRQLAGVGWGFRASNNSHLQAWLCHPASCIALPERVGRGRSQELAGLDAGQPLRLCFRLQEAAAPVAVGALQVLVDYR